MTSPYVFWKLDETVGTVAADVTSPARDGTYTNSPALGKTGLLTTDALGKSALFSAVGGSDHVASTFMLNTNTVTISCWVLLKAYGPNGGVSPIVAGFADGESSNVHDKNLLVEWDGAVRFYVYDGSVKYTSDPPFPLSLNTIYHIAGTFDGTTIRAYVNGKEVGTQTASSSYTGYTVNNFFVSPRTGDVSFEKFGGYVDNVAMWDSALTHSEILAQYRAGTSNYDAEVLILDPDQFLELQEVSGDAIDSSGNSNTGFYDGTPSLLQPGLLPTETFYSVSMANVGWATSYTFPATTTYTACGWAQRTATTNADAFFGDAGGTVLQAASGSTDATFWSNVNFASVSWTAAIPTAIPFFWAVTYDQAIQTAELYINGVSQGTRVTTDPMATPGVLTWGLSPAIGNAWNGRQSHDAWFSSVLTAEEILGLYEAASLEDVVRRSIRFMDAIGW